MKFRLKKIDYLSGRKATIYSIIVNDASETLFEIFLKENEITYALQVDYIVSTLKVIGKETGALAGFFKQKEGKPGDGIEALFDNPKHNLRLYCIRSGKGVVILGGGGLKPKSIKAFQEDPKLKSENYLLRDISKIIVNAMIDHDISMSANGQELLGNLEFTDNEEE